MAQELTTGQSLKRRAALVQQGSVRAAVLGVNDGLVSTLCLVVALAATGANSQFVLTAGFAGLLAGAISMAAGEWISVRAQVELFEGVLHDLKLAIKYDKKELIDSLIHGLVSHGVSKKAAEVTTEDASKSDAKFMALYSAQVVGINQDELGSPMKTAVSSFLLFAVGSIPPIIPWFFLGGNTGIIIAIVLTSIGGLLVGSLVAMSSGKSIWRGAIRQLMIVLGASLITYVIGYVFGVSV